MKGLTQHQYEVGVVWTGQPDGAAADPAALDPAGLDHSHEIRVVGKPTIAASASPAQCGDTARHSPEELLVAAISECHMLWYLRLAAENGIVVTGYRDTAVGTLSEHPDGSGRFTGVVLNPEVTVADPATQHTAQVLHERAHAMCFIASSVNFAVRHEPVTRVA
ncbi:OsmC family peroxiredoxin [Solihabitans fulvus]|uniref:OsmC family peroxiredoxin n=1 Tax=Solihabitans fulvus TaxID=1892852 RepID=A0A5B2XN49_9PSEU|nr:OsmC family protein [Solihabitans fulvus]KAA2264349.1 OsmC family peroxiredoxin [Solihabitans fulvus]